MDPALVDALNIKLVALVNHFAELEADKKEMTAGFAEQIKMVRKRMKAMSRAIKSGDVDCLRDGYDEDEFDRLMAELRK